MLYPPELRAHEPETPSVARVFNLEQIRIQPFARLLRHGERERPPPSVATVPGMPLVTDDTDRRNLARADVSMPGLPARLEGRVRRSLRCSCQTSAEERLERFG